MINTYRAYLIRQIGEIMDNRSDQLLSYIGDDGNIHQPETSTTIWIPYLGFRYKVFSNRVAYWGTKNYQVDLLTVLSTLTLVYIYITLRYGYVIK